jgi:poly(hydroxyalkanoate) granule-associated protein
MRFIMAKVLLKKKATLTSEVEDRDSRAFSDVRLYARKVWLAGLGAYSWAGQEGADYFRELVKVGEQTELKAKQIIDDNVEAANSEIDSARDELTAVKGRVEVQLDKIESAFDRRVASALNRIGIPSKHDVETLSAKLDELTALLERVAHKQ